MCNQFGVSSDITGKPNGSPTTFKVLQAVITTVAVIYPLSLLKKMSALRYFSILSIVSILYTLIVLLIEMPEYSMKYYKPESSDPRNHILYFNVDLSFFGSASLTFFSYTCQGSLLPIYSELVRPNEKRMMKVVGRSLFIDCLFYAAIGLTGYFSTYGFTPDLVIARESLYKHDFAMSISCLAVIIVVIVSSPANFFPFKNSINYIVTKQNTISNKV